MRKSGKGTVDVNRINRKIIDVAVNGLPEGFSSGDLVSNLTLGFWVHLTDRSRGGRHLANRTLCRLAEGHEARRAPEPA